MSIINITPVQAEMAKLMVEYGERWGMDELITPGIRAMAEAKPAPQANVLESMETVRELPTGTVVKLFDGEYAQVALHYRDPEETLIFLFGQGYAQNLLPKHLPLTVIERP